MGDAYNTTLSWTKRKELILNRVPLRKGACSLSGIKKNGESKKVNPHVQSSPVHPINQSINQSVPQIGEKKVKKKRMKYVHLKRGASPWKGVLFCCFVFCLFFEEARWWSIRKERKQGYEKKEKGKVSKQGESKRKIFFSYNSDAVERLWMWEHCTRVLCHQVHGRDSGPMRNKKNKIERASDQEKKNKKEKGKKIEKSVWIFSDSFC